MGPMINSSDRKAKVWSVARVASGNVGSEARGTSLICGSRSLAVRATGKANECEPVFFDEMECRFCVALGRTKIEQPVVAIRDLPALADLFDDDCVRVKGGVSGMSVPGVSDNVLGLLPRPSGHHLATRLSQVVW